MRDILSDCAVTPSRCTHQFPSLVQKANRDAVNFWFNTITDGGCIQPFTGSLMKSGDILIRKRIVEAEHWAQVGHLFKAVCWRRTDTLTG